MKHLPLIGKIAGIAALTFGSWFSHYAHFIHSLTIPEPPFQNSATVSMLFLLSAVALILIAKFNYKGWFLLAFSLFNMALIPSWAWTPTIGALALSVFSFITARKWKQLLNKEQTPEDTPTADQPAETEPTAPKDTSSLVLLQNDENE